MNYYGTTDRKQKVKARSNVSVLGEQKIQPLVTLLKASVATVYAIILFSFAVLLLLRYLVLYRLCAIIFVTAKTHVLCDGTENR